jgi:hypothetical protein
VREVIVWPTVHNTLWQHLGKEAYDNLCDRLVSSLERSYDRLRTERHPADECLFVFTLWIVEDDKRHRFEFHVDDTIADTSLFVLEVNHSEEIIA